MIVSKFSKGLRLTDAEINAFLYTYSKKQQTAAKQGIY